VADGSKRPINQRVDSSREISAESLTPAVRTQRRFTPRHEIETSAVIHLIDLAADVHGRILDLSLGGCHIRTERRFPVGIFRRVEIEFRIEGLPFRLGGVTQAIRDPINVGIRFLDMSDRKREQLLQLIEEIEESERPPG
jgi:c-di-GMP-binding flagellar brake protein YcgR